MADMVGFLSCQTLKICIGNMIRRIKEYAKREPSRDAHKIYIICEGKGTEPYYFSFFEGRSSNLQVITIPPGDGTDPLKLMERAKQVLIGDKREYTVDYRHNDTVWFVIDTDSWEKEGKIAPLRDFCNAQNEDIHKKYDEVKSYHAWNVAQSNPCFEIWLYYHFYENKPSRVEMEQCASFKEFVSHPISGGFNYERDQVRLETAIANTEKNYSTDDEGKPMLYSSEMHVLGKEISGFVKGDLAKLRNKLG